MNATININTTLNLTLLLSKKQVPPHPKGCGLRQALVFRMLRNENSNRYNYILKDVVFISDIISAGVLLIYLVNL